MTKTALRTVALACATLALAAAGQAFAHRGDGGPGRTPPTAAQVGERLTSLKGELKISAAQEGAWKQYEDTVRAQAAAHEKLHAQMAERRQAGTRPDDKERDAMRQQFETERSARQKARDALYATLTPEQKTLADQKLRHGMRAGDGRGMGHGHHGGHHGEHRGMPGHPASAPARPQG
ncbi:Spy/CpxP family protein refolding chaperone [Ideonella sp. DXS22W]|uniref:Spy/CpxP family protein refolding chaperone n=1 Tax=Pseudaquabacterium inlustre TaxID=2984192 RepID=A0ABU9CSA7_9BURK